MRCQMFGPCLPPCRVDYEAEATVFLLRGEWVSTDRKEESSMIRAEHGSSVNYQWGADVVENRRVIEPDKVDDAVPTPGGVANRVA